MEKRISAFFLAVCLTLGMLPGTARAESGGALPFRDVAEDAAYYNAVRYVYENHLMNGISDTMFQPDGAMDRAQLATVLYRLEGSPAVSGESFSDVAAGQWYADAIAWAAAEHLVSGYSGGRFGPADPVTLEDMATILHRYAKYKGYPSRGEALTNFEDTSETAPYAVEPMKWAVNYGVISGGELAPKSPATRAQIAAALYTLSVTGQYAGLANQRRESIRAARTDCTADVTGTIYYISNDGDDSNDGRSPETAWATPYTAMKKGLKAGDAVLFARGDTWYVDVETNMGSVEYNLSFADGVSIGAYGDGAKPVLRGDIKEANDPAFWEIYYEKDGTKIWKAARGLRITNVLVFNEGETWADQILPWWDGNTEYINPDGSPFEVEEALDRDLTFCHLFDLRNCNRETFDSRIDLNLRGALYLRCDAGNPAEVYEVVSVPQEVVGIEILPHSSMRDLDIRYCTMMGTQCTDHGTPMEDYHFANLEIGWCGGLPLSYMRSEENDTWYRPSIAGGAIGVYSTELTVTDCYIHHSGPMALILSMHDYSPDTAETITFKNQRFAGNLFEYCAVPMHWADLTAMDNPGSKGFLSNLVYEDNIVMYTGNGWVYNSILQQLHGDTNIWLSVVENCMGAADNDGIHIRNNVFFLSQWAMINLREYWWGGEVTLVNKQPVFSGNTYVQLADRLLFLWFCAGDGYFPSEEAMKEQIGDTEGTLIVLGQR